MPYGVELDVFTLNAAGKILHVEPGNPMPAPAEFASERREGIDMAADRRTNDSQMHRSFAYSAETAPLYQPRPPRHRRAESHPEGFWLPHGSSGRKARI